MNLIRYKRLFRYQCDALYCYLGASYSNQDTFVFIKPINAQKRDWLVFCWLGLSILVVLFQPNSATAADFGTPTLNCHLSDDYFLFDADIDYSLSEIALEALENGVPLIMQLDIKLTRENSWVWESSLLDRHLRYQIKYQHLASLYLVTDLESEVSEDFVTLEAAITALGTLIDKPIIHQDKLELGQTYQLQLRAKLDVDILPLPLRPLAYINPSWYLSSEAGLCSISL